MQVASDLLQAKLSGALVAFRQAFNRTTWLAGGVSERAEGRSRDRGRRLSLRRPPTMRATTWRQHGAACLAPMCCPEHVAVARGVTSVRCLDHHRRDVAPPAPSRRPCARVKSPCGGVDTTGPPSRSLMILLLACVGVHAERVKPLSHEQNLGLGLPQAHEQVLRLAGSQIALQLLHLLP